MTVFQVVHLQDYLAQQIRNITYYETIVGNPSTTEWQNICDEIRGYWDARLKADVMSTWHFNGITYRQVDTAGLPSFTVIPTAGSLAGTNASQGLPPQCALLVSCKGATVKPRNARTYFTGFGEDRQQDGAWGVVSLTDAVNMVDDLRELNALGTNSLERVAVQWNSAGTQVVAYNNISLGAVQASTIVATQRRRRIGVGI